MNNIRVTKEFHFEMAHALYGYDGACKNIHGHSYKLSVCIIGRINQQENHPKNGMVVDFTDLKEIVNAQIIEKFDHTLVLNGSSPHKKFVEKDPDNYRDEKIILVNYQPTCENLLIDFVEKIKPYFSGSMKLHHLLLSETATSCAEWYADDNENKFDN